MSWAMDYGCKHQIVTKYEWWTQNTEIVEMRQWLLHNIGTVNSAWCFINGGGKLTVAFRDPHAVTLFALRWS